MRTVVKPPLAHWSIGTRPPLDRSPLIRRIDERAEALGTAPLTGVERIIATGHQAWLWHPGILAKDMAARASADRLGASALHLVVDQDVHEALTLQLPCQQDNRLSVTTVRLAEHDPSVPTGAQPPSDQDAIQRTLRDVGHERAERLAEAFTDLPEARTLAEQIGVVLVRLMRPYVGRMSMMMVSDLTGLAFYDTLLEDIRTDAKSCVLAYNQAARKHGEAAVRPLWTGSERVELPLWAVAWGKLRRRVFVDLASSSPRFIFGDGELIDRAAHQLLPRAILLSAVMRWACCDLFIHGTGGDVYDRVTEAWWTRWRSQRLAPKATVSADVRLDFDAPLSNHDELARAAWYRHHLPHNVDRLLHLAGHEAQRKRHLLEHMNDDRDRERRASSYAEVHRINTRLVAENPDTLLEADRWLDRAYDGVANAAVARKRDWCFALYPASRLRELRQVISDSARARS